MIKEYIPYTDKTLEDLEREFGRLATAHYADRIARRERLGFTYRDPLKTMFYWMTEDRRYHHGYWREEICRTYVPKKRKGHGRS